MDDPEVAPVVHPGLPLSLALSICPMRAWQHPATRALLTTFWRTRTYRTLPVAGGLADQPARVMDALDLMATAVAETRAWTAERQAAERG